MLLIEEKKTGARRQITEEAWEKLKNEFGTAHKYRLTGPFSAGPIKSPEPPSEVSADLRKRKKAEPVEPEEPTDKVDADDN
jgi:hypothetical protein